MNLVQFLSRVVAPGNFSCVAYQTEPSAGQGSTPGEQGRIVQRFFAENDLEGAASLIRWADGKGFDTYHAQASFQLAEAQPPNKQGRVDHKGSRRPTNVHKLRSFWIDLDVRRPGGKQKPAGEIYETLEDALSFVRAFRVKTQSRGTAIPAPSILVCSGYGIHVYWTLEDPLSLPEWTPYAEAMRAALLEAGIAGGTGSAGLSADAVRILRPIGTFNHKLDKVPDTNGQNFPSPPVTALYVSPDSAPHHPNRSVLDALRPWIGSLGAPGGQTPIPPRPSATIHALSGGRTPQALTAVAQNSDLAVQHPQSSALPSTLPTVHTAQANAPPQRRPISFARVAAKCQQVGTSLAEHGEHDNRMMWYAGMLSLAHFCEDGKDFVHDIGDGHSTYSSAETERMVTQIKDEVERKGLGMPSCATFERENPGRCTGCIFKGKIKGPGNLGVAEDVSDLPDRHRRKNGWIEVHTPIDDQGSYDWNKLFEGNVTDPQLDNMLGEGLILSFNYRRGSVSSRVVIKHRKFSKDAATVQETLGAFSMTFPRDGHIQMWSFIMAWIDELQTAGRVNDARFPPFGWAHEAGGAVAGFAVGGTLYRSDGLIELIPGGDPVFNEAFTPKGDSAVWKKAASFVMDKRPDLQVIVAASFASPLMRFTGVSGVLLSAWSQQSGVGKSSALTLSQAVWSRQTMKNSLNDTQNSVINKVATLRSFVCNWDEIKLASTNDIESFVKLVFQLTQGKDKARMNADLSQRIEREWQTIMVGAGNYPLMEHVNAYTEGTEAGALRVLEYPIMTPVVGNDVTAAPTVQAASENYGMIGREYAAWLAVNHDAVRIAIERQGQRLVNSLQATQSERFYLAAINTLLMGARIASRMGFYQFDVQGMEAFLSGQFYALRNNRKNLSVVQQDGHYDVNQLLASYLSDLNPRKLITETSRKPSNTQPVRVLVHPRDSIAEVQVVTIDKTLFINRQSFNAWCKRKMIPPLVVIEQMKQRWGVVDTKRTMANGTSYAGGQLSVLVLDLSLPELAPYLPEGV